MCPTLCDSCVTQSTKKKTANEYMRPVIEWSKAGPDFRDMVAIEMFESLQNAESSSDSDSLARFLGPETKRLWAELQAIWKTSVKLDLQDRTVLEGEVLMARILRQLSFEQSDLFGLHS